MEATPSSIVNPMTIISHSSASFARDSLDSHVQKKGALCVTNYAPWFAGTRSWAQPKTLAKTCSVRSGVRATQGRSSAGRGVGFRDEGKVCIKVSLWLPPLRLPAQPQVVRPRKAARLGGQCGHCSR